MRYFIGLFCAFIVLSAGAAASTFEESRTWRCKALKNEVPKQDQLLGMTLDAAAQADEGYKEVKRRQKAGKASYQDVADALEYRQAMLENYDETVDAFDRLLLKTIQICNE